MYYMGIAKRIPFGDNSLMDMQDIEKAYPEAAAIVGMAQSVWNGAREPVKVTFPLSDRLKTELKKLLGKNIKTIFITDSDARHIKKHHGQNEDKRGQVDIIPADFALIPFVLNEYDTAEHTGEDKQGNKKLLFSKKFMGTIYLASIEQGNSQIGVITLWKMKN